MRQRKSTMVELVAELETYPSSPIIEQMIIEARAGEFHDYKNEKYVCGKVALIDFCRKAELPGLAKRVIEGEFDEEADEDDKEMMRKDIRENTKSAAEAEHLIRVMRL